MESICKLRRESTDAKQNPVIKDIAGMRTTEYLLPLIKFSCRNLENFPLLHHMGSETPSDSREGWANTAEVLRWSLSIFQKRLCA